MRNDLLLGSVVMLQEDKITTNLSKGVQGWIYHIEKLEFDSPVNFA